jgi:hypothetical protein
MGAQGEWPSHPELLDELSQWMIDSNWDLKRWIKSVVMSKTYQQSSATNAEAKEKDPFNRYLGRQSRFRLDAEMVRDNALSISGLLVNKLGGKSVRRPVSTGIVHPLAASIPPPEFARLRCPEPRGVHRGSTAVEHAATVARAIE